MDLKKNCQKFHEFECQSVHLSLSFLKRVQMLHCAFKDLYSRDIVSSQETKLLVRKSWASEVEFAFPFLFVLVDAILLSLDLQKRTLYKKNFRFSTLSSNIFAPYNQNLETYFVILVHFDFDYVI